MPFRAGKNEEEQKEVSTSPAIANRISMNAAAAKTKGDIELKMPPASFKRRELM